MVTRRASAHVSSAPHILCVPEVSAQYRLTRIPWSVLFISQFEWPASKGVMLIRLAVTASKLTHAWEFQIKFDRVPDTVLERRKLCQVVACLLAMAWTRASVGLGPQGQFSRLTSDHIRHLRHVSTTEAISRDFMSRRLPNKRRCCVSKESVPARGYIILDAMDSHWLAPGVEKMDYVKKP